MDADPTNLDLRVVTYEVAARPTRTPRMTLYVSLTKEHGLYVERDKEESDLVVEFSVCRQLGHTDVIGPVPDEWSTRSEPRSSSAGSSSATTHPTRS